MSTTRPVGRTKPEFGHWALPDVPSELEPRLGFMHDMAARGVRFIGGMGMGMPIVTFDTVACSAQVYARLLGFDPWRAIRSITSDAAAALGLAGTTGAIRAGLAADLVAVPGDPIVDLAALRTPSDVIQAGRRCSGQGARWCSRKLGERVDDGRDLVVAQVLDVEPKDPAGRRVIGQHDDRVPTLERLHDLGRRPSIAPGSTRIAVRATGRSGGDSGSVHVSRPSISARPAVSSSASPPPAGDLRRLVACQIALEGDEQPDDLLLARLHRPADAVARDARESAGLEERATRPRRRQHVEILMLEPDGPDEVGAPRQEPGRLRAPDRLPAAERDEVGAGGDEPPKVRGAVAG
jgi:hypothetical protein